MNIVQSKDGRVLATVRGPGAIRTDGNTACVGHGILGDGSKLRLSRLT